MMSDTKESEYLTYGEAAEMAGVSKRTMWTWCNGENARFRVYMVGHRPRVKRSELEAYLKPVERGEREDG